MNFVEYAKRVVLSHAWIPYSSLIPDQIEGNCTYLPLFASMWVLNKNNFFFKMVELKLAANGDKPLIEGVPNSIFMIT